uniref:Reverse transcriptase domain-containing protein n=1 Tax=Neolamprologus brichardi TaxID=32507 RepID=A0A3Q4G418_NEOBR
MNDNIRKVDGSFVKSTVERLQRWKEYFNELYNHDLPQGPAAAPPIIDPPTVPMSDAEPTVEEVKLAIHSLKNNKAAGLDHVAAEALKAGGEVLVIRLHSLFKLIWTSNVIPANWKKAAVIPILKKGDNRECKNYRGISSLSIVGKVLMKIIQSRLQKHCEMTSREEQAGFRPGRGCSDQIFTLRRLMEERIRCGRRTVIIFIDFKSAFDCINRPALWRALAAEHIPVKIIELLQTAYDGSTSQVRIHDEVSEEFPIMTEVRQGDVVSPLLFNIVIDAIMRKAFEGRRGVQASTDRFITNLMFADDSAIFAEDDTEATHILYDIARHSKLYGLKVNAEKTKVLTHRRLTNDRPPRQCADQTSPTISISGVPRRGEEIKMWDHQWW